MYTSDRYGELRALGVIPVRNEEVAFRLLNNRRLIDYKLEAALKARRLEKIVVSSPSPELGEYIQTQYGDESRIFFHLRDERDARMNVSLAGTVSAAMNLVYSQADLPDAIALLTIEYPLTASYVIDDAIHTMFLFKSDSLIGVRQDNSIMFQHRGSGMQAILNQDKVERIRVSFLVRLVPCCR